ncbi:hypothetical protein AADG42_13180 [Ammonicoccus fulvus]|uniref:Prealbumin-like fold domain-containing protein n=1 Tax=Ammonicoccus fulvus TaxID=3138240 RepID=A0ABZ3FU20_9ACTN
MANDKDGADNNDACASVQSPQLSLIKQIVDAAGNQIAGSTDSKYFDLVAAGPSTIKGSSTSTGVIAARGYVSPGTYLLGEQGNDGGATSGTYKVYASWSCTDTSTGQPVSVTGSQITLSGTMNVQCVIKNTRTPKVHIVKTAATPTTDNAHIGATIKPATDGAFLASYKMTVMNTSGFTTTTGAITDGFAVPAGLLWEGTKTATVTYDANGTGATVTGLASSLTQSALSSFATLATSVNNLPTTAPSPSRSPSPSSWIRPCRPDRPRACSTPMPSSWASASRGHRWTARTPRPTRGSGTSPRLRTRI